MSTAAQDPVTVRCVFCGRSAEVVPRPRTGPPYLHGAHGAQAWLCLDGSLRWAKGGVPRETGWRCVPVCEPAPAPEIAAKESGNG